MKSVLFCKSNPISFADNNCRILLNVKKKLTIERLSLWNEICCKLNESINVIKEMIDVRVKFKEFQGFGSEEVEGLIETLYID